MFSYVNSHTAAFTPDYREESLFHRQTHIRKYNKVFFVLAHKSLQPVSDYESSSKVEKHLHVHIKHVYRHFVQNVIMYIYLVL